MKKKLEVLLQKELNQQSKIFIISPHLDDSVFSLGGLIYLLNQYTKVVIINVFSYSNYCNDMEIDAKIATQTRKEEDALAIEELCSHQTINLDFKEALLRGYSRKDIFINKSGADEIDLTKEINFSIKRLINNNDLVIAPSAFGSHIDHLICRDSINDINNILFYEDLPYANRNMRNDFALDFLKDFKKRTVVLNKNSLEKHLKATMEYKSQILERQFLEIKEYISTNGISLWQK